MKIIAGLLIAAALAFSSGCAKTDWIDRTLVTVDVTGSWRGSGGGGGAGVRDVGFELEQKGPTVTGLVRAGLTFGVSRSIEGTVAGDVFHFRDSRGNLEGELTVSGDEMNGRMSFFGSSLPVSLRRDDPSSRPASPPR
jgi:hypothetical protein